MEMNQLQIYLLLLIICIRGNTCKRLPLYQTTTVDQDVNQPIHHPQRQQPISPHECPHEFQHNCHFCHLINEQPTCGCREGFIKNDLNECVDIDECRNREILKTCSFRCVNTLGSYFCQEELQSEQPSEYDEDDESEEYDMEEYEDYREEIGGHIEDKDDLHYNSEDDDYDDDDNDYYDANSGNDVNHKISGNSKENDILRIDQDTKDMSTELQKTTTINYNKDYEEYEYTVENSKNRPNQKVETSTITNKDETLEEIYDEPTTIKLETVEATPKIFDYNYSKEAIENVEEEKEEVKENLTTFKYEPVSKVTTKNADNYDDSDRKKQELETGEERNETITGEITTESDYEEKTEQNRNNTEESYSESNVNETRREETLVDKEMMTTEEEDDYRDYDEDDDEEEEEEGEEVEEEDYSSKKTVVNSSLIEGTKEEEEGEQEKNYQIKKNHSDVIDSLKGNEEESVTYEKSNHSSKHENDISVTSTEKNPKETEISTILSVTVPVAEEEDVEDEEEIGQVEETQVETLDTPEENNYEVETHTPSAEDDSFTSSTWSSTIRLETVTNLPITTEEVARGTEIYEKEDEEEQVDKLKEIKIDTLDGSQENEEDYEAETYSPSSEDDSLILPNSATRKRMETVTKPPITSEEIVIESEMNKIEEEKENDYNDYEVEAHSLPSQEDTFTPYTEASTKQIDTATKGETLNGMKINEENEKEESRSEDEQEEKERAGKGTEIDRIDIFKENGGDYGEDVSENSTTKSVTKLPSTTIINQSRKEEDMEENGTENEGENEDYDDYDDYLTEDIENEDEETTITTTERLEDGIVTCMPGFEATVSGECFDIDECLNNNGNCSQICKNTIGSYYCECNNGFDLDQNQKNCNKINPCLINNGGCSHNCLFDNDGNVFCSCPSGYFLEHNKTCKIFDLCQENNGNCSHYCSIINQQVHCSCPRGYHLENSTTTCIEEDPCLLENGGCSHYCQNSNGNIRCMCPENYTLIDDRNCELIDPCSVDNGGCTHYCSNSNGTSICSCPDHYNLINGIRCVQVDPCLINNGGCSHQCQSDNGTIHCLCPDGYQLNDKQCIRENPCTIKNGGCSHVCETINGQVICKCPPQYELIDKTCFKINPCLINNGDCSHICINDNGIAKCTCPIGYHISDNKCIKERNPCERNNGGCSHYCQFNDGRKECLCPSGYQLKSNQQTCKDINECQIDNGGCLQNCENLPGSYQCTCSVGYILDDNNNTTCLDIDECLIDNGDCEQICNNLIGSYTCGCNRGYLLQPDGKSCKLQENKGCYTLVAPRYSTIRCNNHHNNNNNMMPIGTQCMVWCDPGFKLIGDYLLTCQQSNYWNFNLPKCKRVGQDTCTKLPQISNGRLLPDYCNKAPIPVGKTCHLFCEKGYKAVFNKFTCTLNQNWQPSQQHLACFKDPKIRCPGQVDFILPEGESYMFVKIPKPETDVVDWNKSIKTEPYWAKFLQATLPAGRTEITFSIYDIDTNRNLTSCRLIINIVDKENPRIYNCPSNIEYTLYRGQSSQIIYWREPTFEDNVGVSYIYKSKEPGTRFGIGLHHINYVASDEAGNRAFCHFTINIKDTDGEFSNSLNQGDLQHSRAILVCPQSSNNYNNQITTKKDCYWRHVRINNQFQGLRIPQHKIHSGSRLPSHLQRQYKYFDWYEKCC